MMTKEEEMQLFDALWEANDHTDYKSRKLSDQLEEIVKENRLGEAYLDYVERKVENDG